jgi:exodeoxyribonuclease V alpha subunit
MVASGVINKIIFDGRKDGKNFVIFSVQTIESIGKRPVYHKVVGTGHALIKEGAYVEVEGELTQNNYGEQIRYSSIKPLEVDKESLALSAKENALTAILTNIPAVGTQTAKHIISHLNLVNSETPLEDIFHSLTGQSGNIPLIGMAAKTNIVAEFTDNAKKVGFIYQLMTFSNAITRSQALKACDLFECNFAPIKKNPYLLVSVNGITFELADRVARESAGFKTGSPEQVESAFYYAISEDCERNGHTWLFLDDAYQRVIKLVGDVIPKSTAKEILHANKRWFTCIGSGENEKIFLTSIYKKELLIAENVNRLLNSNGAFEQGIQNLLRKIEKGECEFGQGKISLSDEQTDAIVNSLDNKVSVITGGPGVGKTTVLKELIWGFIQAGASPGDILSVAPTGKAAKRMEESTGLPSLTMHRALEYGKDGANGFVRNADNPFDQRIIIADEQSMTDIFLKKAFMDAVPDSAHLVIVGDVNQLPSIGHGTVLRDLINSETIAVSRLNKIFRQAMDSGIVLKSHALNDGDKKAFYDGLAEYSDIKPLEINDEVAKAYSEKKGISMTADELTAAMCVKRYQGMIKKGHCPYSDIQVLTPMRKGRCGVYALNADIRDAVNRNAQKAASGHYVPKIESSDYTFYEEDKIIQTKNDYEIDVMNGETGKIIGIDMKKREVVCRFDEKTVNLSFSEFLNNIQPAWVITGHKSQGSEYKGVIVPLSKAHSSMMIREYLYTVITRAKEELHLIGDFSMIDMAISNKNKIERQTGLKDRLEERVDIQKILGENFRLRL